MRERKKGGDSGRIVVITPIFQEGGGGGGASVSPKSNVLYATLRNKGEIFNNPVEDTDVPSLPDAPGDRW
jgi:hypothetical protein